MFKLLVISRGLHCDLLFWGNAWIQRV